MPIYRRNNSWRIVVWARGRRHERSVCCTKDEALAFEDAMRVELGGKTRKRVEALDEPETPALFVYFPGTASSHVYFVQEGDDGPVKIGFTAKKGLRLTALQNGNPTKLRMVCAIPGGRAMERVLHEHFGKHRLEGEWFEPTAELRRLMADISNAVVAESAA